MLNLHACVHLHEVELARLVQKELNRAGVSLVAKLIVHGANREEALARGRRALDEFVIEGIQTTIPFHKRVLDNEVFCAGEATTDFIETQMGDLL